MVTLEELKTQPKLEAIILKDGPLFDLIIIGGGPAGLTAALYAGRAKLKTLVIEKALLGGMASTTFMIENYPGFPEGLTGMELAGRFDEHAKKFGADIYYGEVAAIKAEKGKHKVQIEGKNLGTKALILATGSEPKKLNIKGEEEFRGRGVSYCATCDGAFYRDKNIVVVGGGNSAIEEALFLTRYAKKISIIHRRDKLRADKILAERVMNHPQIFIIWNSQVEEILGRDRMEEIKVRNLQTQKVSNLPAEGIFIYVGSTANTAFLSGQINLDKEGFILTDEQLRTSVPGIFAAGDVRCGTLKQVVTAAADGARAAESARRYIEEELTAKKK
jgi:thioredoxin reductase (NADPH)